MTTESEAELIEQAKTDPEAFGELYERYVDRIYTYIYYRVGNAADAEDLTSRVFYRVLKALPRYVDRGAPFGAWLYRIAHNLVANFHRDQSRHHQVALDEFELPAPSLDNPEQAIARRDEAQWLWRLLDEFHINDDRQELLVLKFGSELSNAEIGTLMSRTEGAIKSLYHRTLVSIREEFERRGLADYLTNRHR